MKFFILILAVAALNSNAAQTFSVEGSAFDGVMAQQSSQDLCFVAQGTLDYLAKGQQYDPQVIKAGVVARFGVSLAKVKATLAFVCQVEQEDRAAKRPSRLADPEFIKHHFKMIRWRPDKTQSHQFESGKPLVKNIPDDKILLTKYYIKLAQGNLTPAPATPHALYAIPHDEQHLSLEQAAQQKDQLTRFKFTKNQVLSGVIDQQSLAEPLVWLSRDDLEDTLMQGTVKIALNGVDKYFNVHRNNGIGYQRNLKKRQQKRYWYFKQTPHVLGYGKDANYKIPIEPLVTVAGDLAYLGLGKLIMLTHNGESRLTILADTGGAFENNQYQLDYLGGFFKNWQDYIATYRTFPDYFEARILILKSP